MALRQAPSSITARQSLALPHSITKWLDDSWEGDAPRSRSLPIENRAYLAIQGWPQSHVALSSFHGVAPANAGETREVGICGDEFATMLQSHGSQVGVRDEVCASLPLKQHFAEHSPVPFGRMHNPHAWLVYPAFDAGERLIER